jgi:DNA-binding MarR family transcriptional regulator
MIDQNLETAASFRAQECARQTLRLIPQFSRWVSAQVEQDHIGGDLSLRQLTVLYYIREQTPTLGYIAKQLMVTPAVVTGIVDRLERRGFVRRTADAGDRRVVRLSLTESGRKVSIDTEHALIGIVAARLDDYPEDELATLQESIDRLGRVLAELERRAKDEAANGVVAAVPARSS